VRPGWPRSPSCLYPSPIERGAGQGEPTKRSFEDRGVTKLELGHEIGSLLLVVCERKAAEEDAEHLLVAVEKIAGDAEMLGLFVFDGMNAVLTELVNHGVGVGHDDGRVGGDDELGAFADEIVDEGEGTQLALRGEGGFGLVEDVEAVAVQSIRQQRKE